MKKIEFIQLKRNKKGEYYFMTGQVTHPKDNPEDYTIKIGKKGSLRIVAGENDVYILDDYLTEEAGRVSWENYLEHYKNSPRRGQRSKGDIVRHPMVITEENIQEALKKNGIEPCYCKWISLNPKPEIEAQEDVKRIISEIEELTQKVKEKIDFNREEINTRG